MSNPNVNINNEVGEYGTTIVTGTGTFTPATGRDWFRFVPLTTSVINSITSQGESQNSSTLNGATVTVGSWLDVPHITSFKLTSGTGILYYHL